MTRAAPPFPREANPSLRRNKQGSGRSCLGEASRKLCSSTALGLDGKSFRRFTSLIAVAPLTEDAQVQACLRSRPQSTFCIFRFRLNVIPDIPNDKADNKSPWVSGGLLWQNRTIVTRLRPGHQQRGNPSAFLKLGQRTLFADTLIRSFLAEQSSQSATGVEIIRLGGCSRSRLDPGTVGQKIREKAVAQQVFNWSVQA
ncbi:hypothetical protein BDY21DRAFT_335906 [Lineolata rhizophorae]|uniref:Uncharacterized protein n=1 Tax=Lineolata rhizophorae TaxID=578093 RepID=A0A6A6P9R0_9PEZI|nr:hypothetical protein BDY21DRAFT_335906 [Lineolata rhizophorae]